LGFGDMRATQCTGCRWASSTRALLISAASFADETLR
jgi:hypothetical protein